MNEKIKILCIVITMLFNFVVKATVIDNFDFYTDTNELTTDWVLATSSPTGTLSLETSNIHTGSQSMYHQTPSSEWYTQYKYEFTTEDWSSYGKVSIWIKGDTNNSTGGSNLAQISVGEYEGGTYETINFYDLDDPNWNEVTIEINDSAFWENIGVVIVSLVGSYNEQNVYWDDITLKGLVTITESGGSTTVTEGGATDSYELELVRAPDSNVVVTVTPDDPNLDIGAGAGNSVNLTFTTGNWSTAQTVTVTPANDSVAEGNHTCVITHTVSSNDSDYNNTSVDKVAALIIDNDFITHAIDDFESYINDTYLRNMWVLQEGSATSAVYLETTTVHDGSKAMKFVKPSASSSSTQLFELPNIENWDRFTKVSVWVKADAGNSAPTGEEYISFTFRSSDSGDPNYDSNYPGIAGQIIDYNALTDTNWCELCIDVNEDFDWGQVRYIEACVSANSVAETMYIDDIILTGHPYKIAILKDSTVQGQDANLVDSVTNNLRSEGFSITQIDVNELAWDETFNTDIFNCLILTHSPGFPENRAKGNFIDFIDDGGNAEGNGGDVVFMGGGFPRLNVPINYMGIHLFEDYEPYYLSGIEKIATAPNSIQDILETQIEITDNFEGLSAIAPTMPNEQRFLPLLVAYDEFGRDRGWAASFLANYNRWAHYYDSYWLIYGIDNTSFYEDPNFTTTLVDMLEIMRDRGLATDYHTEHFEKVGGNIPLTSSASDKYITLNNDADHLEYSDSSPFFMIGTCYIGSFDRLFFRDWNFYPDYFKDDFRKMKDAGINVVRLPADEFAEDADMINTLKQCLREYDIYLVLRDLAHSSEYTTKKDIEDRDKVIAENWNDDLSLWAYDLEAEIYFWDLGVLTDDSNVALATTYPYNSRDPSWWDYTNWLEVYDSPRDYGWHGSTYPGINSTTVGGSFKNQIASTGVLPVNTNNQVVYSDVNSIYGDWLDWHINAIETNDVNHLITCAYNEMYSLLHCNSRLDFITQHIYREPNCHADVHENLTTIDRAALIWDDRPIVIGEFGYTNGLVMSDSNYLDMQTSALGEMMHYLYPYTRGFDGVRGWMLWDIPLANSLRMYTWLGDDIDAHLRQGRYGLYYYDGTKEGRPKPIVYAMKFFRDYLDSYADMNNPGTFTLSEGATSIGAVYEYIDPGTALFVGDMNYNDNGLQFNVTGKPTNVMMVWDNSEIKIMSTRDVNEVRIKTTDFISKLYPSIASLSGTYASSRYTSDYLYIYMLEGETVTITASCVAPDAASTPNPSGSATNVSVTADLSWTAGTGATSHDVYFGTSQSAVANATKASAEYKGNQAGTTYDPGTMSENTTYYWRIDQVNTCYTPKGAVWSFSTSVVVDNFESYSDTNDLTVSWELATSSPSGALSLETSNVHTGSKSMHHQTPSGKWYTQYKYEFTSEDWSSYDKVSVWIKGDVNNSTGGSNKVEVKVGEYEGATYETANFYDLDNTNWNEITIDIDGGVFWEDIGIVVISLVGSYNEQNVYWDDIHIVP